MSTCGKKLRAVKGNNQVDFSERKNQAGYRDKVTVKEENIAQNLHDSMESESVIKKLHQNNQNKDNCGYLSSKTDADTETNNTDYRIQWNEQETFFRNLAYNMPAVIPNHYLEETFSRG